MVITDPNTATKQFRVSIRKEATTAYVHEPKLGKYRAYSYTPGTTSFNIQEFIKSGPYGSETLKNVGTPNGSTDNVKLVIVYCSLDHVPLLIYYGPGEQTNRQTHHWYKNTGQNNEWKSARGTDSLTFAPPKESTTNPPDENAQNVRNVLERVNCTVNGIVQIDVSKKETGQYCHEEHSSHYRIKVSGNKANESPYTDLLKELKLPPPTGQYTVFEHTPHNARTLTISAFKKAGNYLKGVGIPTAGANDSYISGVKRVVVFLNNSNPCLIYYEALGGQNEHNWYKYQNTRTGWQNAGELNGRSPEDEEVKEHLKTLLENINGDASGSETPDSNVTLDSTGSLNLNGEGSPTEQYNCESLWKAMAARNPGPVILDPPVSFPPFKNWVQRDHFSRRLFRESEVNTRVYKNIYTNFGLKGHIPIDNKVGLYRIRMRCISGGYARGIFRLTRMSKMAFSQVAREGWLKKFGYRPDLFR